MCNWAAVFYKQTGGHLSTEGKGMNQTLTKLANLTNNDLSRWIAKKQGWTFEYSWHHRDMVNDPTMTVMLIHKILDSRRAICITPNGVTTNEFCDQQQADPPIHIEWSTTATIERLLGRAVAEAFALANKLIKKENGL